MSHSITDRTAALAGVFQAAGLAHETACSDSRDSRALDATLGSIFKVTALDTADVYGGLHGLRTGLQTLRRVLASPRDEADLLITRYALGLLHLEKQARHKPTLLQTLRRGIERAQSQVEHFGEYHDNVVASLANVYVQTIGTLRPRIMVNGDETRLRNPRNVDLIRAILLGGVRSAFLWGQYDGSRWSLLFSREIGRAHV